MDKIDAIAVSVYMHDDDDSLEGTDLDIIIQKKNEYMIEVDDVNPSDISAIDNRLLIL